MYSLDITSTEAHNQNSNLDPSTSTGIVATTSVSRSKRKNVKKKNRILQRRRVQLDASAVEDHLRTLNKTHVALDLDSNLADCNLNQCVTNAEPLKTLNVNASCVFCRKNISSGDHATCVANSLLSHHKKRAYGRKSRPTTASKSVLGRKPNVVSKDDVVNPVVANNTSRNMPSLSNLLRRKHELA